MRAIDGAASPVYPAAPAPWTDGAAVLLQAKPRYYKMHPYSPSAVEACTGDGHVARANPRTFPTSFGVTFGMHLCYDVDFHTPAMELALGGVRGACPRRSLQRKADSFR